MANSGAGTVSTATEVYLSKSDGGDDDPMTRVRVICDEGSAAPLIVTSRSMGADWVDVLSPGESEVYEVAGGSGVLNLVLAGDGGTAAYRFTALRVM